MGSAYLCDAAACWHGHSMHKATSGYVQDNWRVPAMQPNESEFPCSFQAQHQLIMLCPCVAVCMPVAKQRQSASGHAMNPTACWTYLLDNVQEDLVLLISQVVLSPANCSCHLHMQIYGLHNV